MNLADDLERTISMSAAMPEAREAYEKRDEKREVRDENGGVRYATYAGGVRYAIQRDGPKELFQ